VPVPFESVGGTSAAPVSGVVKWTTVALIGAAAAKQSTAASDPNVAVWSFMVPLL